MEQSVNVIDIGMATSVERQERPFYLLPIALNDQFTVLDPHLALCQCLVASLEAVHLIHPDLVVWGDATEA
jgi:hypothetical protein